MTVSTRIEFIPAKDRDPWVAHARVSRVKLHPRIECVEEGTIVAVTLAGIRSSPGRESDDYERIEGIRRGKLIVFSCASKLYPELTCTPWDQFAIQRVQVGHESKVE